MSKQDWTLQYLGIVVNFALHLALQCGIGLGWPSLWENKGRMRARTGCTAPQKENLMHESTKGKFCLIICWMKDVSRQINKVERLRPLNHTKYLITQKKCWRKLRSLRIISAQGGRTWQPFVGSKIGNENFRQARIYNFRVKCVVFARNCKFANLTQ